MENLRIWWQILGCTPEIVGFTNADPMVDNYNMHGVGVLKYIFVDNNSF